MPSRCLTGWLVSLACYGSPTAAQTTATAAPKLDVVWVPTPPEVIAVMLDAAKVGAQRRRLRPRLRRGRDPHRRRQARRPRRRRRPRSRAHQERQDQRGARPASPTRSPSSSRTCSRPTSSRRRVVTLYLLPELNLRLQPTLMRDLKPGTPVVSHDFDMGDWKPEQSHEVQVRRTHRVYLWKIPAR